jgi:preprotein translocase subunit Sss1
MSLFLGTIAAILVVGGVGYLLYLLYVWLIIRSIF